MFEVGWTEMLVIAIVMIVVVGPKDLPQMLRTFGRTTAKLRAMAGDFQKQFNEALKEAELDDVKKSVDSLRSLNPAAEIRKQLNPFEKAAADVRSGIDQAMKPKPVADPAVPVASSAEPLKNGATEMPGVGGPETMPAPPVFPPMTEKSVAVAPAETVPPPATMTVASTEAKPVGPKAAKVAATAPAKNPVRAAKPKSTAAQQAVEPVKTASMKAAPAAPRTAVAKPSAARKKTAGK